MVETKSRGQRRNIWTFLPNRHLFLKVQEMGMKHSYLFLVSLLLLALVACGTSSGNSAQPLPTVVLDSSTAATQAPAGSPAKAGGVTASGVVAPAQDAQLAFTQGGTVKTVSAVEGDQVQAGQLLIELDNTLFHLDLDQAKRNLKEMTSPASIAAASQAVASAQKVLEDAQDKADSLTFPRASDTLIQKTQGQIDLAKQALSRASDSYRQVSRKLDGDPKKSAALVAMTNAQLNLNDLIARINWYSGRPNSTDAALIQANLDTAKATLLEAQWYLAALNGEPLPEDASGSQLAMLQQAKDAVTSAQKRLDNTRLVAPISGTVVTVNVVTGEYAAPAAPLILISDVAHLHVETTDLSERDVPKVEVGQTVGVFVESLGENLTGRVSLISPVSDTLGGDVVYKTTIELDAQPAGLRSGMSVEVQFGQ
jgi:multidrug efflux pump subunit AcrA (membrane-fusion protein)